MNQSEHSRSCKSNFPDQSKIPCPGRKTGFYSFLLVHGDNVIPVIWGEPIRALQSCPSNFPHQSEIPCHVASKKFPRARAWRAFVSRNPRVKFSEKKLTVEKKENECMFFFEMRILSRTALRVSSFQNVLLKKAKRLMVFHCEKKNFDFTT